MIPLYNFRQIPIILRIFFVILLVECFKLIHSKNYILIFPVLPTSPPFSLSSIDTLLEGSEQSQHLLETSGEKLVKTVCLNEYVYDTLEIVNTTIKKAQLTFIDSNGKSCQYDDKNSNNKTCFFNGTVLVDVMDGVYTLKSHIKMEYGCCEGWSSYSKEKKACVQAICDPPCKNGRCLAPNSCFCKKGWKGRLCETDINECAVITNGGCQQKCINTKGNFKCQCEQGFQLNSDKKTCRLCLDCIPEYKKLKSDNKNINQKLEQYKKKLEEENSINVTDIVLRVKHSIFKPMNEISPAIEQAFFHSNQDYIDYFDLNYIEKNAAVTSLINGDDDEYKSSTTRGNTVKTSSSTKLMTSSTTSTTETTKKDVTTQISENPIFFPKRRIMGSNGASIDKLDPLKIIIDYDKLAFVMDRLEFMSRQLGRLEDKIGTCNCETER